MEPSSTENVCCVVAPSSSLLLPLPFVMDGSAQRSSLQTVDFREGPPPPFFFVSLPPMVACL